ncbi:hypothetical protein ACHAXM_004284 [Skeletonema potamos]
MRCCNFIKAVRMFFRQTGLSPHKFVLMQFQKNQRLFENCCVVRSCLTSWVVCEQFRIDRSRCIAAIFFFVFNAKNFRRRVSPTHFSSYDGKSHKRWKYRSVRRYEVNTLSFVLVPKENCLSNLLITNTVNSNSYCFQETQTGAAYGHSPGNDSFGSAPCFDFRELQVLGSRS